VNSEITDARGETRKAWLFYDGQCQLCLAAARRSASFLHRRGFALAPLQTPWVREALRSSSDGLLEEMRLLLPDGRSPGGADAILEIARRTIWGWPLVLIAAIPGAKPPLRRAYRYLAARRHCFNGSCSIQRPNHWFDWAPLLVLPLGAGLLRARLAPWIFMWLLTFAIFLGCKWLTLRRALRKGRDVPAALAGGYLLAWPGMDASAFLFGASSSKRIAGVPSKWIAASSTTIVGALLVFMAAHAAPGVAPILRGWLGMTGIVLTLHFGLFKLLALAWQQKGLRIAPVMRQPLAATSFSDFWGKRWNTAFNQLANEFVFRRLARPVGIAGATMGTFLVSGLVHDLAISFPARGGYGLPTLYFLLQGLAILVERSKTGRTLGLGHGWRGRTFTLLVAAGPAFWLFHPPFIRNVILPMLDAIGAI